MFNVSWREHGWFVLFVELQVPLPKVLGRGRRGEEVSPPGKQVPSTNSAESATNEKRALKGGKEQQVLVPLSSTAGEDEPAKELPPLGVSPDVEVSTELPPISKPQEDDEEKAIGVSPDGR